MSLCTIFKPEAAITKQTNRMISSYDPITGSFEDFLVGVKSKIESFFNATNKTNELFSNEEFTQIVSDNILKQKKLLNPKFSNVLMGEVSKIVEQISKKSYATISKQFTAKNDDFSSLFFKSNIAYNYMQNSFKENMLKTCFINKEVGKLITTDSELNNFILEYKNELFEKLKNYIGNTSTEKLYDDNYAVNEELYNQVFNAIDKSDLINTDLNVNPLDLINVNKKLDPYNAAIILNNFDNLVNKLFDGIINTEFTYKGFLENGSDKNKYTLTGSTIQSLFWAQENDASKDSGIYSSNLMKMISATIPITDINGDIIQGQYLGMNNIYKIATLLKKVEIEAKLKNIEGFTSFIENPKKMLEYYLKNTNDFGLLRDNKQILDSLYKYLYDNTPINGKPNKSLQKIQDEFISTKNKGNGNLTNNIDLIGLFAFELMKNVSPEYRSYNKGELKTINLASQDEVTGGVKSLIGLTIREHLNPSENNPFDLQFIKINGVEISKDNIKNLTIQDIDSNEFKQYFKSITGLTLSPEVKDRINLYKKGDYLRVVKDLTSATLKIYDSIKNSFDSNNLGVIDSTLDTLSTNDAYVLFSQNYIKNQPKIATTVIKNAKGDSVFRRYRVILII